MVYSGFEKAIDQIIQAHPDAVVHAGDVFHHVRPKIKPLFIFQRGLQRLAGAGIPVIIISGNHDAPKSFNQTSPFRLFEGIKDVHIAQRYSYERFEVGDHTFHCIPFCLEPQDYLNDYPLEAVAEIHLAGHSPDPRLGQALWIDSHDAPISESVWALYQSVIERAGPVPTLVEREGKVPAFDILLAERNRAHGLLHACTAQAIA